MKMIKFKYQWEKTQGQNRVLRPVASVIIRADKNSLETSMYVDSGADVTLIPLRIGRALQLTETAEEIQEMKGISTLTIPYVIKQVKVTIGSATLPTKIAWALTDDVPALLGRSHIFPKFRITLDEAKENIEFEKN
jgi:hypothetical protein